MIGISISLALAAFIAGIFMFLAPCTLPLVPAYLAFISGVRKEDLENPQTSTKAKKLIIKNGITFVLGFSIIFIIFGMLAGLFGSFVGQFRVLLSQVGGAFIILFGLMMLGVLNIAPLRSEKRFKIPSVLTPGEPLSAFVIGSIFALGWTPCVGPVLASVLLLASTSTTVSAGGILLAIFSLGLAIPFVLTAILYSRVADTFSKYSKATVWVGKIGGMFLILIGALLITNNFILTVEYGYKIFNFFGIGSFYQLL